MFNDLETSLKIFSYENESANRIISYGSPAERLKDVWAQGFVDANPTLIYPILRRLVTFMKKFLRRLVTFMSKRKKQKKVVLRKVSAQEQILMSAEMRERIKKIQAERAKQTSSEK